MLQDTICFTSSTSKNEIFAPATSSRGARRSSFTKWKEPQFSREKLFKWFTFLPFETPTTLFLPKIGTVLLYSSSFSMINVL
jgi:hypothetical protein